MIARPVCLLAIVLLASALAPPATAASVARTYSYFSVGGATLPELQEELSARGPKVKSTGRRHPGATEMEFSNRIGYEETNGKCRASRATVSVKARITLPRWTRPGSAQQDTRLIWDALAGDIKRHEESHVGIARNHAREMEDAVLALPAQKNCELAAHKAKETIQRIMAKHDAAQNRFDDIERINFTNRMDRLIRYRIQQIESGRIKG
jgi:predicted secreted Zn-dependent protease